MKYFTITSKGKRKRMPKTVTVFGRREKMHRPTWVKVQKVELRTFKKKMKKMC